MRYSIERIMILGFGVVVAIIVILIFGSFHMPGRYTELSGWFYGLHLIVLACLGLVFVGIRSINYAQRLEHAKSAISEALLQDGMKRLASVVATHQEIALINPDLDTVMQLVVERTHRITQADSSVVELLDGEEMVYRTASGTAAAHIGMRFKTTGLSGRCVRENTALRCDDSETDDRADREMCRHVGERSIIVVPLTHEQRPIGVLKVLSARDHAFHENDVAVLQLMAGMITAAMNRTAVQEIKQSLFDERERALQALQESQENLNLAQALTHIGSWKVNLRSGAMLWSDELFRIFGFDPKSTTPSHAAVLACLHPEDRDRVDAAVQCAKQQGIAAEMECRFVRPDGSLRYLKSLFQVTRDANGRPTQFLGTIQDITDMKTAETARRLSEERFRLLAEDSPIGIFQTDAEGRCLYINARLQEITGLTLEESLRNGWTKTLHPDDRERVFTEWMRCARENTEYLQECRLVRPDGAIRWVRVRAAAVISSTGERVGYVGTVGDITEIWQAGEAVRKSEEGLNRAQALAHIGSWEFDLKTRRGSWSDEMFRLYDLEPAPTPPSFDESLLCVHPDDREKVMEHAAIAADEDIEFSLLLRDGTLRYVHARCEVIKDKDGIPTGMRGTLMDITERKQFEHQIQAANEWLSDANAELQALNTQLEQQIALVNEQALMLEMQKAELKNANKQLEALATTDSLTGIKNHRAFLEKAQEEFDRARRYGSPLSLLLLDVDHFKQFNDTYGHPAGDQVLKQVGAILQANARATDFVARYGGEEFVVILTETDRHNAIEAAERLRAAIAEAGWEHRAITVSIGVTSLHRATENVAAMAQEADKALYASKAGGRNRATYYEITDRLP